MWLLPGRVVQRFADSTAAWSKRLWKTITSIYQDHSFKGASPVKQKVGRFVSSRLAVTFTALGMTACLLAENWWLYKGTRRGSAPETLQTQHFRPVGLQRNRSSLLGLCDVELCLDQRTSFQQFIVFLILFDVWHTCPGPNLSLRYVLLDNRLLETYAADDWSRFPVTDKQLQRIQPRELWKYVSMFSSVCDCVLSRHDWCINAIAKSALLVQRIQLTYALSVLGLSASQIPSMRMLTTPLLYKQLPWVNLWRGDDVYCLATEQTRKL